MHKQVIYFGAPGTGKSHNVDQMIKSQGEKPVLYRVTIHPEFTYSDFVGQLLPAKTIEKNGTYFEFVPGPFTLALQEAFRDSNKEIYLVLEELSRGNVSAIFGDIFQLLDRDVYFRSKYPIVNDNIASKIPEIRGNEIYLPSNLNIICTVNTNDQSVFPMDTAFKRRFDWQYVSSRPACDEAGKVLSSLNNPYIKIDRESALPIETNWQSFYSALNSFIVDNERGLGRNEDRQIGQFFISFKNKDVIESYSKDPDLACLARGRVESLIRNKLLLYLWQDVQGVSAFGSTASLFSSDISSFNDLFDGFGKKQVFSDSFLTDFLAPHFQDYPYRQLD